jgi:hypothetical protein
LSKSAKLPAVHRNKFEGLGSKQSRRPQKMLRFRPHPLFRRQQVGGLP